jgi:carbon monoxide dehydrogenase subunit G
MKLDREKIMSMDAQQFAEWLHGYKRVIPPYRTIAWAAKVHIGTIKNTANGASSNEEARKALIDAIEEALGELQQAALS